MGQFLFAPIGQGFISAYGRGHGAVPAVRLRRARPAPRRLAHRPRGDRRAGAEAVGTRGARRRVRHPSFLLLTSGFFVCGFHIAFISTHLPAYLTDLGLSTSLAAWSLSLIGLFNVIGAYSAGILGGAYPKRLLLSGIYLGRGIAFALFLLVPVSTRCRAAVRRRAGPAVALDGPADLRARRAHVRDAPCGDAVRDRLPQPPGRAPSRVRSWAGRSTRRPAPTT